AFPKTEEKIMLQHLQELAVSGSSMQPTKLRWRSEGLILGVAVASLGWSLSANAATYTTFDPSGSIYTEVWGLSEGAIAGDYQDSNFNFHGYVRAADGTITAFDPAGSILTSPIGINKKGATAGYYRDANSVYHGF